MHYPDELTQKMASQQYGPMGSVNAPVVDYTWILIEGLKRLSGGQRVLDAYDAARDVEHSPGLKRA